MRWARALFRIFYHSYQASEKANRVNQKNHINHNNHTTHNTNVHERCMLDGNSKKPKKMNAVKKNTEKDKDYS